MYELYLKLVAVIGSSCKKLLILYELYLKLVAVIGNSCKLIYIERDCLIAVFVYHIFLVNSYQIIYMICSVY